MTTDPSATAAAAPKRKARMSRSQWFLLALRLGLLAAGVAVLVLLIREAGPEEVLAVLLIAAIWLPLLIALEAIWVSLDIMIIRNLYGEAGKRVPWWAYVRSALIAYPFMALFPAGRAAAEAARATALARWVGGPRAAAAAAQGQGCMLLGNGLWSIPVLIVVGLALHFGHMLVIGIAINMAFGLIGGAVVIMMLKGVKFGGWLGKISQKLATGGAAFDELTREKKSFRWPIFYAMFGRSLQFLQYSLFIVAIGGVFAVDAGMLSHGIHLVGAMVGDFVPNQVGVVDAAYAIFAPDVYTHFGFPSVEVAIAAVLAVELLRRICQIFWSIIGAAVPIFWTIPDETWKQHELEALHAEQVIDHPIATFTDIASQSAAEVDSPQPPQADASRSGASTDN